MNDIERLMNKGRRATAATLGLAAIAMFLASKSLLWPAVVFGLSVGYLNLEILYRRVGKTDPSEPKSSLRLMRTGSGLRFSAALLGALAVVKFNFNIAGYVVGLMTPHFLITLIYALQDFKKGKG